MGEEGLWGGGGFVRTRPSTWGSGQPGMDNVVVKNERSGLGEKSALCTNLKTM